MLKKAVQQGRSQRRPEEVQTALRVGRSPLEWILANGKTPSAISISLNLLRYVEDLNDARTTLEDFFHPARAATRKPSLCNPIDSHFMTPLERALRNATLSNQ